MMKKLFLAVLAAVCALLLAPAVMAKEEVPVSRGLAVLAANTDMAKTALVGDNIGFSADDFKRALNLSEIKSVTIETVPNDDEGKLFLGSAALTGAQSVSSENLSMLTFIPASDSVRSGSFTFSVGGGYSIKCNLHFVEKTNYSPTVSLASDYSLTISTHDRVSRIASLDAYDPEGDKFVYEIVSYPKNGSLVLLNRDSGQYVYTPKGGFTGNDSFSYVARDIYGNYSAAAEVAVNVRGRETAVSYGDITDCNVYNAALTMAENSLMTGTEIDGITYFSPAQSISRAEFLSVAMKAAGISDPGSEARTVFADDEDIPGEYRGYISAAYQLGFINGSEIDGDIYFLPSSTITRAEAAVMINGIISGKNNSDKSVIQPVFADSGDLPAWATEAIYNLNAMGILTSVGGYASPEEIVTRGSAAQMFEAVINIFE
ncbi:MAG: S-layer homology domain-containing protein [Clostridia bacterium]|nr:S-layer homology domain-containing protein [Clostridia bacterium]